MAEFDGTYISAPWSTPKIPRTFSTPGYAGQVSGGAGVTGELSPFPPLLLGRSLSHALPSLGPNGSQGLPASINALFQPGVFQFQCDPPDNSKPAPAPEPIRQASEPIAAPKPKASSTPSGQIPVQGAPTMPGQESRTVPPLPARGRQGVTHRHRNEVGLCQEPAFSTMQLEQCAAQCRKEVEAIAARCRAEGQKFNDPDFPAAKTSLFASTPSSSFFGAGATNASWRREAEVEGQQKTEDSPAVLHVGALGSFPLQGALATMQSMGKDPKELIVWHEPEAGVYGVRFFKDGEWMYEVLDDNLPVSQNGRPLYSSCGHEQQDWAALIEKGYAKLHGSYEAATNCQEEDTLEDVLGVASGRISVGDFPVWAELWQHLRSKCKRRYALAAIRRRERPGEVLTSGLLGGCAYPVLSLDVVNGHALVALENPWPQGKWNGSWGPDSLEVLRCGLKQQPGNTFWMSIQDFCQHFTDVTEARLIPSSWQSAMVSMSEERPSYPLVSVSSPTQAIFCLTQADSRLRTNRNFAAIGLRVYRCRIVAPPQHSTGAKQNVSNPFKPLELLAEKLASKVHSVTVEIPKLEPNCLYVASTVTSPEASPDFAVLRVLTSMPMRFRELSVPESAYFLQAEEQAVPAVDTDSFSSQGSAEDHAQEPAREDAMKAAVAYSRATGSAVSESCQGSEVSENWPGECGTELDLGFDLKLPPFLEDMLKHCSGIDC